jgi:hypothetical protein
VSTKVVIVGGLPQPADRNEFLRKLAEQHPAIEWDWIQPDDAQFHLPKKPFNRLLHELRIAKSTPDAPLPSIVKLFHLNGREAASLHREYGDPILAPIAISSTEELATWLFSADAGIVPPTALPVRVVGLLAVLSKLIRNKSWNKDVQGHMWTKEADLLGQAPVNRPHYPEVYSEALDCMERALTDGLLLTKGGSQGKTPKEFSINTKFLPGVKRAMTARDVSALREFAELTSLMDFVDNGPDTLITLDGVIISEKVLMICREPVRGQLGRHA